MDKGSGFNLISVCRGEGGADEAALHFYNGDTTPITMNYSMEKQSDTGLYKGGLTCVVLCMYTYVYKQLLN